MADLSDIPDEAVTEIARSAWDRYKAHDEPAFDALPWTTQTIEKKRVKVVLAAALPVMDTAKDVETVALEVIGERDDAEEWADRLAYAIAPVEVIGEHSSTNNPWQRALDEITDLRAENDRLTRELAGMSDIAVRARDHNARMTEALHTAICNAVGWDPTAAWPGNRAAAEALSDLRAASLRGEQR